MVGEYTAHLVTGDVLGAGTDENPLFEIIGEIQGQIFFIGRLQFSGAGNLLERGSQVPDSYGCRTNGSMLDAVSCNVSLANTGTSGPDWFCEKVVWMDGDLGDVHDPANWFVAVCEINDWVRADQPAVTYAISIEPALPYLLPQPNRINGPGRRLPPIELPDAPVVPLEVAEPR